MNYDNLHEYQKAAVRHIMQNRYCALFLEMGLGKTVSTLTAIQKLIYEELDIMNVLVVAPKRVAESVWDAEINKWEHLSGLKVVKISGDAKKRRKALQERADIYTIGRDNIAWLCSQYGGSRLPFDMLVIDELSSFKSDKSVRFKALKGVRAAFRRIVGLTGTPAPNGLIDLWAQIYILDGGQRLGRWITQYRKEYFVPGRSNGEIVYEYNLQHAGEQRIYRQIEDICLSMKAEDYLTLPGRMDNIIELRMDPELQAKYDEFEKQQVLKLYESMQQEQQEEATTIRAINAAALSTKLLQFANGAIYDEDGNVHKVHDMKIDALKEIVEDAAGKPILIAWTYRHDRDRIMEALAAYRPRELKDGRDIDDWNAGRIRILMMHPASGGHGLNLQAGGHIIVWFGQTWSLELEQQFNARLDRQGQKETVIIHRLVACNTIDQDVIQAINKKAAGQEGLMQAVKARLEKYVQNFQ